MNTYTTQRQANPSVAMHDDGFFVVTWDSIGNPEADPDAGVQARFYDTTVVRDPLASACGAWQDERPMDRYLRPTSFLDADHPRVRELAETAIAGVTDTTERGVRLYYAVRDGLRYDPYSIDFSPEGFTASAVIARGRGYCVAKATVLAAAARAVGIPSRLGFADVRNHLATSRLREQMGTDVFYYHGYTELHLEGRWVKATPAFNIELCQRFGVRPLEFDGREDSIFHPLDAEGRQHMEYLHDRGSRDDVPLDELREAMARLYPHMHGPLTGDFHAEAGSR